ncbi:MAG: kelch repeat-containing protein [Marmoricola sp.]
MTRWASGAAVLAVLSLLGGCAGQVAGTKGSAPPTTRSTSASASPSRSERAAPTRVRASFERWRLPFPVAREAAIADAQHPGQVVVAGGLLPGDQTTGRSFRLQLQTGRVAALPPLAVPVHDAAGGSYAGNPAVFGGGNATEQSLVQALVGNRWRTVDRMPTTRSDLSVADAASGTLVIGGYDGVHVPRTILRQRRSAPLRPAGRLNVGVRYAAVTPSAGAVYVFGGEVAHRELDAVQRVDVRTGRTRTVAHLPRPLGHAQAAAFGDRILLMGGRTDPDTQTDQMWWFDPTTSRFTRAGRLPVPLSDAATVSSGRSVWLLGGESPSMTDRVVRVAAAG